MWGDSTNDCALPVILTLPCPVSRERHGTKYWQHPSRYGFARTRQSIALTLADVAPAAACFPIVFAATADGPVPHALLRISDERQTPFIGPDGRWHAAWVPPGLAAHPFGLMQDDAGAFALSVDEATGFVGDDPRGAPFFAPDGTLSPEVANVAATLRARSAARSPTLGAGRALETCGVLVPVPDMAAFMRVDPARAATLEEAQVLTLHRAGALGLLHGALVSALHYDWLRKAEALAPLRPTAPVDRPEAPHARDFLDALGMARDKQRYIG